MKGGEASEEKNIKGILGLVHRHYELLKLFMPEGGVRPEYTLTGLQELVGKDIGYLSRLTEKLIKAKLLESYERPREGGGRPYKVLRLSELGIRLISSVEEAVKPRGVPIAEVDPWKIEECLKLMDEAIWSEDLRYRFAYRLFELVEQDPPQALSKSGELKRRFEGWIASPPAEGKVAERIRATVSVSFRRLLIDESTRDWALSQYPKIKDLLNRSEPEIQLLGIGLLEDLAATSDLRAEIADFLIEKLLAKPPEEIREGKIPREMLVHLSGIIADSTKDEKRKLFDKLRARAEQGEDAKQKVEYILDQLMTRFF